MSLNQFMIIQLQDLDLFVMLFELVVQKSNVDIRVCLRIVVSSMS